MTTAIEIKRWNTDTYVVVDEEGQKLSRGEATSATIDALLQMQEEARQHRANGHLQNIPADLMLGGKVLSPKQMHDLKAVTDAASSRGNADANDYLHGMANGLILALAIVEGKQPEYVMRRPGEVAFQPIKNGADLKPIQPEPARDYRHIDDIAADKLNEAMRLKLAKKRAQGWGGWSDPDMCSTAYLSKLLMTHVVKGDPVDVANLCAFLHFRGETIDAGSSTRKLMEVYEAASALSRTLAQTTERQEAFEKLRALVT